MNSCATQQSQINKKVCRCRDVISPKVAAVLHLVNLRKKHKFLNNHVYCITKFIELDKLFSTVYSRLDMDHSA